MSRKSSRSRSRTRASSPRPESIKGAGIVLTAIRHGVISVLLGKESRYITDFLEGAEATDIKNMEQFHGTREEAHEYFKDKAKELSARYGRIQFAQITGPFGSSNREWRTKFHSLRDDYQWGIPKGRAERGESPLGNARREFAEEIGYSLDRIPDSDFVPFPDAGRKYAIFRIAADGTVRKDIEEIIEKNREIHYSELFDAQFISLVKLASRRDAYPMNSITKKIITILLTENGYGDGSDAGLVGSSAAAGAGSWRRFSGGYLRKIAVKSIRMQTVGSKAQVFHGTAKHTSGGLEKKDLVQNKHGRIVSRRKMMAGKKALKFLTRKGYVARKGRFTAFKKHSGRRHTARKQQGGFF